MRSGQYGLYHPARFLSREIRSKILDSVKKKKKKKDLPFNYTPILRENQVENSENLMQIFQKIFRKYFQVLSVPDRSGLVKGKTQEIFIQCIRKWGLFPQNRAFFGGLSVN